MCCLWRKWLRHLICNLQAYAMQLHLQHGTMFLTTEGNSCTFSPLPSLFIFSGSPSSKSFFFHSICHAICLCYNFWHQCHVFQSQKKKYQPGIPFLLSYAAVFLPVESLTVPCALCYSYSKFISINPNVYFRIFS